MRDGGIQLVNNDLLIVFGVDMIAKIHNWENNIPFIQHELFHVYHIKIYKPSNTTPYNEEALYNTMWLEGLATYISKLFNPGSSYAELLLDIPKNLKPEVN